MGLRNQRKRLSAMWPCWFYGPDGQGAIFNGPNEVPWGWVRRPGQKFEPLEAPSLDRDWLVQELTAKGIAIDPTWGKAQMKKVLDDCSPSR